MRHRANRLRQYFTVTIITDAVTIITDAKNGGSKNAHCMSVTAALQECAYLVAVCFKPRKVRKKALQSTKRMMAGVDL